MWNILEAPESKVCSICLFVAYLLIHLNNSLRHESVKVSVPPVCLDLNEKHKDKVIQFPFCSIFNHNGNILVPLLARVALCECVFLYWLHIEYQEDIWTGPNNFKWLFQGKNMVLTCRKNWVQVDEKPHKDRNKSLPVFVHKATQIISRNLK